MRLAQRPKNKAGPETDRRSPGRFMEEVGIAQEPTRKNGHQKGKGIIRKEEDGGGKEGLSQRTGWLGQNTLYDI